MPDNEKREREQINVINATRSHLICAHKSFCNSNVACCSICGTWIIVSEYIYLKATFFLAGVCFDHALCCVGVARQNFHKLITLWFFGGSSGFNTLSWNQKPKELGERHFNWIREVNRHRKAKRCGMGWKSSWRTEISKNPPLRRYIHLCWAIHGLVSLYLGIWVSAKCTRRDDRRKQINRVWTPK